MARLTVEDAHLQAYTGRTVCPSVDVTEIAERLLAGPAISPCLELAEDLCDAAGMTVERLEDLDALVAWRGERGCLLSGHVDVVPVGEGWSVDPFGNAADQGRLYGRGASDMRGPVAAMLAALTSTEVPAGLVLTSDEETTMATVRELAGDARVTGPATATIVGEPTGLDVATCGKGVAWMQVTVTAPSGHASTPRGTRGRAASAPERLIELMATVPAEPLELEHPVLGQPTLAVTGLGCQEGPFNVLAPEAWARIDGRFPAPVMPDEMVRAVQQAMGHPEDVEITLAKREPPFEGPDQLGDRCLEALDAAGLTSEVIGVDYASEAGHWQTSCPTVVCGPGSIARAHKPDEHITLEELEAGVQAYTHLLETLAEPA